MTKILAADIGGTKTLLQLTEYNGHSYRLLAEQRFDSHAFPTFGQVLTEFLSAAKQSNIHSACFAVAGPVSADSNTAYVTNLPWTLDRQQIEQHYSIDKVSLINDFHAVAAGINTLTDNELETLQQGEPRQHGNQLVIGAGTGLGVAQRIWNGTGYQILASESGHAGFAPQNAQQRELLEFLAEDINIVSREHLLSGQGLVAIYRFLCQRQGHMCQTLVDASQISQVANDSNSDDYNICNEVLELFCEIYGSESGNLALTTLPFGGVFIAGGVAAKNIQALKRSHFVSAFGNKSKMNKLLLSMPIHVINNEAVGLHGARLLASQNTA